jgi:hypothetical protein
MITVLIPLQLFCSVSYCVCGRFKVLVTDGQEFVLMVRDARVGDGGLYQCQVSGPQHTSLTRTVALTVIGNAEVIVNCLGAARTGIIVHEL